MFIVNFFRSRAEMARRIKSLEFNLLAAGLRGHQCSMQNDAFTEEINTLKTENAHLRRQLGGYKAGETRRNRKGADNV